MIISCVATTAFSQKISEPNRRIPESPELFPGLSIVKKEGVKDTLLSLYGRSLRGWWMATACPSLTGTAGQAEKL